MKDFSEFLTEYGAPGMEKPFLKKGSKEGILKQRYGDTAESYATTWKILKAFLKKRASRYPELKKYYTLEDGHLRVKDMKGLEQAVSKIRKKEHGESK